MKASPLLVYAFHPFLFPSLFILWVGWERERVLLEGSLGQALLRSWVGEGRPAGWGVGQVPFGPHYQPHTAWTTNF